MFWFQVTEISDYLGKKDDIKTFSLRNACLDSENFENIQKALKTTKSEIQVSNIELLISKRFILGVHLCGLHYILLLIADDQFEPE